MSKKQRAKRLMEAAERVVLRTYSCSAISAVSEGGSAEADKYADYVGVERQRPAFNPSVELRKYTTEERQLTRELAILMYREAVLAGEI